MAVAQRHDRRPRDHYSLKRRLSSFMVLNLAGILGWVERKGSALIQDRIGANRASIFGFAGMGLVNTLIADPLKFLTKEDFIPPPGDKFPAHFGALHGAVSSAGDLRGDSLRRCA